MSNEKTKEETKILKTPVIEIGIEDIRIPECCRSGWKSCPHVVKRQQPNKRNIGM